MLTSQTHLLVRCQLPKSRRTYSRGPLTKSWGPVVINIEKELLDWDGKTGGAQYTVMLEEELLCKQEWYSEEQEWYSEEGGGVLRNGGLLPFLPSLLHLRPDVSDVRAAHAAMATRGYNH